MGLGFWSWVGGEVVAAAFVPAEIRHVSVVSADAAGAFDGADVPAFDPAVSAAGEEAVAVAAPV